MKEISIPTKNYQAWRTDSSDSEVMPIPRRNLIANMLKKMVKTDKDHMIVLLDQLL